VLNGCNAQLREGATEHQSIILRSMGNLYKGSMCDVFGNLELIETMLLVLLCILCIFVVAKTC
jgi:hypothetical protein